MITLPKELQEAVHASGGQPVRLADPETREEYVILPASVFDQVQEILYEDSPLTKEERRKLFIQAGLRAHWNDREMDAYNDLDPRRQP